MIIQSDRGSVYSFYEKADRSIAVKGDRVTKYEGKEEINVDVEDAIIKVVDGGQRIFFEKLQLTPVSVTVELSDFKSIRLSKFRDFLKEFLNIP